MADVPYFTYCPGRPPIEALKDKLPCPPWRVAGDSMSAWIVWKRGGRKWEAPSYVAQFRPDRHFYAWYDPGRREDGGRLGSPVFLGRYETSEELLFAVDADKALRDFAPGLRGKKNPNFRMETIPMGSVVYRGTPYGKRKFPRSYAAWFTPDRDIAMGFAVGTWAGNAARFAEKAEKTPSVRKYRVNKPLKLPFTDYANLAEVLAHYGAKAGLGDVKILHAAIDFLGFSSGHRWGGWRTASGEELGEWAVKPLSYPAVGTIKLLGAQFEDVGAYLEFLCKRTDFSGWVASYRDGGSELLICNPKSVLRSSARQPPFRNRREQRKWGEKHDWEALAEEVAQEEQEEADRKQREEDEFRERKRELIQAYFPDLYAKWDEKRDRPVQPDRSDPRVRMLLKNWDKYLTEDDFKWFGPKSRYVRSPARTNPKKRKSPQKSRKKGGKRPRRPRNVVHEIHIERQGSGAGYHSGKKRKSPQKSRKKGGKQDWRRDLLRQNPEKDKRMPVIRAWKDKGVYDPRKESIRAVDRATKGFGIARYAGGIVRRWTPAKIIQHSWERYQDPDKVIRDRQEYELMLGETRASGPYRITHEPTRAGLRYFVWPLPKGQRVPVGWESPHAAGHHIQQLYNHEHRPARSLPKKKYTKAELADWLPPAEVFKGRSGRATRAAVTAKHRPKKQLPAGLLEAYRAFDPAWHEDPELCAAYLAGQQPPRRK